MDPALSAYDEEFSRKVAEHVIERMKRLLAIGILTGALVASAFTVLALTVFPNRAVYVGVTAVTIIGLVLGILLLPASLPRAWGATE